MTKQPSLAGRAVLALGLMTGFYLLAVAIAAVLLWLPYAEWHYAGRLHVKIALFCVIGGGVILWSVLPRFDRFDPPGPQLLKADHPRLFAELESVAKATQQEMPAEVYLVADVNAWVSQRGGIMGFGSRRVMGLGLPLMRVLRVAELRGVLAHEFGHYHGGDTKLGPWIYKTRSAIGRTLRNLGEHSSALQKPFEWYAKLFLRITHAISRRQEYAADALAAQVAGARWLMSGLKVTHGAGAAYQSYWDNELVPVLNAGFRPPMAEGFARFLESQKVADSVTALVDKEMTEGKTDPYDTHPPLRERLAALAVHTTAGSDDGGALSVSLLENVPALEHELLVFMGNAETAAKLQNLDWEKAGELVYLPSWQKQAREHAARLEGLTPAGLPALAGDDAALRKRFGVVDNQKLESEQVRQFANAVIGSALATAMAQHGFAVGCELGAPITMTKGIVLEPFGVFASLLDGKLAADQWRQQCAETGLAEVDLGRLKAPAAAAAG